MSTSRSGETPPRPFGLGLMPSRTNDVKPSRWRLERVEGR